MTEAINFHFTPQLLHLESHHDSQHEIQKRILQTFGDVAEEYVSWKNTENATFSIEMVRDLIQEMSFTSFKGKTRHVVLLSIDKAPFEAQNALLKLLEEPPAQTQFWLTVTQSSKLLPTVISRCEEIFLRSAKSQEISEDIKTLATNIPSLSHRELSELTEKYSEREDAKKVIEQLTLHFHEQLESTEKVQYQSCLKILLQTAQYLEANVTVRLALENSFFSLKKVLSRKSDH